MQQSLFRILYQQKCVTEKNESEPGQPTNRRLLSSYKCWLLICAQSSSVVRHSSIDFPWKRNFLLNSGMKLHCQSYLEVKLSLLHSGCYIFFFKKTYCGWRLFCSDTMFMALHLLFFISSRNLSKTTVMESLMAGDTSAVCQDEDMLNVIKKSAIVYTRYGH